MWIKVILVVAIATFALIGMRAPRGARHLALRRISLIAFGILAALTVVFPDVWNSLANAVGVGRGTDLLLYLFIVVMLGYMASTYLRFRGVETQITLLSRRIALDEVGASPVAGQDPALNELAQPTAAPAAPAEAVAETPAVTPVGSSTAPGTD
jgi:hypothetical protein